MDLREKSKGPDSIGLGLIKPAAMNCLITFISVKLRPIKQSFKRYFMAALTYPILSNLSAGISELKKNPMAVIAQAEGAPIAILNRNQPVFYAVPADIYEALLDRLDDLDLIEIVKKRQGQAEIEVSLNDL